MIFSNTLVVTGNTTLSNTVAVTGSATLANTLVVTGAVNALSTFGVTGAVNALSTLGVTGAVNALSTLGVTGTATFTANVVCDTDTFVVDAVNNRVGIGNATPSYTLDVNGTTRVKQVTANSVLIANSNATHIASWSAADGSYFRISAGGNFILNAPSSPLDGQKIIIRHYANGANRTLTLNTSSFVFGTDINSSSITATTSGLSDLIGCIYDSNFGGGKWFVMAYMKGYA